jgi:phospholipid/cholesterol/gamma-HCH transport system substrate-binding protein
MQRNMLETAIGAIVLAVAGVFLFFAYSSANVRVSGGYAVKAKFDNAAGISIGSDVRIGGIKIGVVEAMNLDPNTYQAVIAMQIKPDTKLPADTTAAVVADGLLGSKYIDIAPGGDDKMLAEGGTIQFTQSSVNLEQLIGKFVFSGGGVDSGKSKETVPTP